jgi:phosphoserine phosphatase
VTRSGSPSYVPPADRIAVFDNDGTLWVEQPMYTQLAFVIDQIKALAPMHPEWQTTQPFQAALEGDMDAVWASGSTGFVKLLVEAIAGMTSAEFDAMAGDWIADARHPRFGRLYTEAVYQPMLELLAYLRRHEFKTFIVSAGGLAFMRPWIEEVYGIPPERVVGSTIALRYEIRNGVPALLREPEIFFLNNEAGKAIGIRRHIGRRPIAAFGNSDGDLEMLRWTTSGPGRRLGMIVHHTDEVREYAYDRKGPVGTLDAALDAADENGWSVIDMKRDWNRVFPFDR